MKRLILIFLLAGLSVVLNAQNFTALKFIDNKLIDKKENQISKLLTQKSAQQFTNDNYQDLEAFTAVNPKNPQNIITAWMWADPSGSVQYPLVFYLSPSTIIFFNFLDFITVG